MWSAENFLFSPDNRDATVEIITGSVSGSTRQWQTWQKPKGKNFLSIIAIGNGGNGGNGAIGANSTAAGGGGGGSGGISRGIYPLILLPDTLYFSIPGPGSSSTLNTVISYTSGTSATDMLIYANAGAVGGDAVGATAGTAGAAAVAGSLASCNASWISMVNPWFLGGHAGTAGGTTAAGTNVVYPNVGLFVSGGSGGAGLGAAGAAGNPGGIISVTANRYMSNLGGGTGGSAATTPPGRGNNGELMKLGRTSLRYYGGTGGGSTHGTATGAGLVQASGGNGDVGCGGGGSGGALTGATPGSPGLGGPGQIILITW